MSQSYRGYRVARARKKERVRETHYISIYIEKGGRLARKRNLFLEQSRDYSLFETRWTDTRAWMIQNASFRGRLVSNKSSSRARRALVRRAHTRMTPICNARFSPNAISLSQRCTVRMRYMSLLFHLAY